MKAEIITAISGAAVAVMTYILGKKQSVATIRKTNAEAANLEAEAESKQSEQWERLYHEMNNKVEQLSVEVEKFGIDNDNRVFTIYLHNNSSF